jgi:hypothetical protein
MFLGEMRSSKISVDEYLPHFRALQPCVLNKMYSAKHDWKLQVAQSHMRNQSDVRQKNNCSQLIEITFLRRYFDYESGYES